MFVTQADRDGAARIARARVQRQYRGTGYYPVTVGGYVVGAVEKRGNEWYAIEENGTEVPGGYINRHNAVLGLVESEYAAQAYRDSAREGAQGTAEEARVREENYTRHEEREAGYVNVVGPPLHRVSRGVYATADGRFTVSRVEEDDYLIDDARAPHLHRWGNSIAEARETISTVLGVESEVADPELVTDPAPEPVIEVGSRVIQPGTDKGRGTVVERTFSLGVEMAGVQWDERTLIDWMAVDRLVLQPRSGVVTTQAQGRTQRTITNDQLAQISAADQLAERTTAQLSLVERLVGARFAASVNEVDGEQVVTAYAHNDERLEDLRRFATQLGYELGATIAPAVWALWPEKIHPRVAAHQRLTAYLLSVQAGTNPARDGIVHRSEILDAVLGPLVPEPDVAPELEAAQDRWAERFSGQVSP